MAKKKKLLTAREPDWEKEDDETTLAPDAQWMRRVNVDFPVDMLKKLDEEAQRRGINRQALIKTWLIDRLDEIEEKRRAS